MELFEPDSAPVLHESDLATETGLPAREIHGRLVVLSRAQHRVESALAFYLLSTEMSYTHADAGDTPQVKESRESYGVPALALDPRGSNVVPRGSESTNDRRMRRARASAVVSLSSLVPRGSIGEIRPMRPTI